MTFTIGFLYHLLNVVSFCHAALLKIVWIGTPALCAAFAEAALVDPGEKTVVSIPANSRVVLIHLLIVAKVAASYGAVDVMNKH